MTDSQEVVPLKDAIEQVKTAVTRIALIHLGFSKTIVEELGRLYCYVDSAKSMATDPSRKLIHTACEPLGDGCCAFDMVSTLRRKEKILLIRLRTGKR